MEEESLSAKSRVHCSVPGCKRSGGRLFKFPNSQWMREQWRLAARVSEKINDYTRVCDDHFAKGDLCKGVDGKAWLKFGVVPSLNLTNSIRDQQPNMRRCIVPTCRQYANDSLKMHYFPRNKARLLQWASLCGLPKLPTRHTTICSDHFSDSAFHTGGIKEVLNASAVPSLKLPEPEMEWQSDSNIQSVTQDELDDSTDCFESVFIKEEEQEDEEEVQCDLKTEENILPEDYEDHLSRYALYNDDPLLGLVNQGPPRRPWTEHQGTGCTAASSSSFEPCSNASATEQLESEGPKSTTIATVNSGHCDENQRSSEDHSTLSPDVFRTYSEKPSQTNDLTVLHLIKTDSQLIAYTGTSYALLDYLEQSFIRAKGGRCRSALPIKERIVLTLIKLRLNMSFETLAVLFNINRRRCYEYFYSTLSSLAAAVKDAVFWCSLEDNKTDSSKCFATFEKTRIILECAEFRADSTDCLKCRWKSCSNHETSLIGKHLIGVAPSGLITLIRKSNKASDDCVSKKSDSATKKSSEPLPDASMSSNGSPIEAASEKGVNTGLIRPPLLKNKMQHPDANDPLSVGSPMKLEMALKRLNKFTILNCKIDDKMETHLDDIMTIMVGITNLSDPILDDQRFQNIK